MLFTSAEFLLFFLIVLALYWGLAGRSGTAQNVVLLLASTFFYGWADPRFLLLLFLAAGANYLIGIRIADARTDRARTAWLRTGVAINLATLGFFKYFGFFHAGFVGAASLLGFDVSPGTLHILLPLGISFITFQNLAYLIDVHNEEIEASRAPLDFFVYVTFFPKILAGPIERAQRFLPQIAFTRSFDPTLAVDGCRQILWGLLAKVVIADPCSAYVDLIFNEHGMQRGSTLLVGAFLYFLQIYCDFSGYSNIAIGLAKLVGIRLMTNFAYPFFATNISDFWKRWHISLTTWMMDYLFTPISFLLRRLGKAGLAIAIFCTFLAVGIWHGVNWTYVVFGVLQSLYFLPLVLRGSIDRPTTLSEGPMAPNVLLRMTGMFILMMFTFVLLRAESVQQAAEIVRGTLSSSLLSVPKYLPWDLLAIIVLFLVVEWMQRRKAHALDLSTTHLRPVLRVIAYYGIVGLVLWHSGARHEFIYFQF